MRVSTRYAQHCDDISRTGWEQATGVSPRWSPACPPIPQQLWCQNAPKPSRKPLFRSGPEPGIRCPPSTEGGSLSPSACFRMHVNLLNIWFSHDYHKGTLRYRALASVSQAPSSSIEVTQNKCLGGEWEQIESEWLWFSCGKFCEYLDGIVGGKPPCNNWRL